MRAPYRPQRILLTGATGAIGRFLVPSLRAWGAPIRALVHRAPLLAEAVGTAGEGGGVEIVHGDLERPATLRGIAEGCDVVVHAAARHGFATLDRDRQHRINVGGTKTLLREAEGAGASVFVLIGYTGTVQERNDPAFPVDEQSPPEAEYESDFVRMKYEAEALVLEANRPGAIRTMVVSPGIAAAPGAATVLGGLIGAFLMRELPVRLLDGVWIALTDARDVGPCVAAAIERGHGGRRYFATGECLRLGALYDRIADRTGVPAPRRHLPDLLLEELGLLVPFLPPQSFLRRLVLPRELVFHLRRLAPLQNAHTRTELGFTPTSTDDLLGDLAAEAELSAGRADLAGG